MAVRLRCIHHWMFSGGGHGGVHRRSEGASSKAGFSSGVFGNFETAWDGIRSAVCVGMIHAGPTGRRGRGGGTDTPGFTRGYFHVLPTGERRAARLAAIQRRRAPDPHQRYFEQLDGGGRADWGGEIGLSQVPKAGSGAPGFVLLGSGSHAPIN